MLKVLFSGLHSERQRCLTIAAPEQTDERRWVFKTDGSTNTFHLEIRIHQHLFSLFKTFADNILMRVHAIILLKKTFEVTH